MRIAFAGTPVFARTALAALHAAGHEVVRVLTQPDRPAGRGLKMQPSPVKELALAHGWPVGQPRSLRLDGRYPDDAAAERAALQAAAPELMVVAAYGLLLPAWVLALPPRGCLNIHGSLLPRWRGAAPIQRAIEAGDAETGITIMQMDEGLDTGPMLLMRRTPIGAEDTSATLHDRLAVLGAELCVEALALAGRGALQPHAQPAEGVTYAAKIEKREAAVDWRLPAAVIERRLRAFDPFPGGQMSLGGEPVKLWRGAVVPGDPTAAPGTVLASPDGRVAVACGDGRALALLELQRPGGRRLPAAVFFAGGAPAPGTCMDAARDPS